MNEIQDKDGLWLDAVEEQLFQDWKNGDVTNEFRNHFQAMIAETRDWL